MAAPATRSDFLDLLQKSGVCEPATVAKIKAGAQLPDDVTRLAAMLVKQAVITSFQAKLLLQGRHKGFKLGPYLIRDQIGQGGMGTVYLAEHITLRRWVALKVLPVTATTSKVAVERFLREARAAAALDHPNIVRIFDVGKQGGVHYLAMEYVEGQTLDKLVQTAGPLGCNRAVEFIVQAAAGLQHAHEKGFVHRDIKPANLILSKDGIVRILDMGLARSFESADKLTEMFDKGAVVGTADYISPEQAMNSPDLDIRADIYSLGATFFTLVTGRTPFQGTTTQKLLHHQMTAAPSITGLDKTLPPGLASVVAKMLAKKPENRYSTPANVIDALSAWMPETPGVVAALSRTNLKQPAQFEYTPNEAEEASSERKPTRKLPSPKRRSKLPWLLAGLVLAVLAAGAIAAWMALGGKKQEPPPSQPPLPPPTEKAALPPEPNRIEPTLTPAPAPPEPPRIAPAMPGILAYELDLAGQQPFTDSGSTIAADPDKPNVKKWVSTGRTGEGQLPTGWDRRTWNPESEVEFGLESGAMTVRTRKGPASGMLFTPELAFPSGTAAVRFDYQTDPSAGYVLVKFRPTRPKSGEAWEAMRLPATPDGPGYAEGTIDLKEAQAGYFEFHPRATNPEHVLRLSAFTARDPAAIAEKVLYKLDLSKQGAFAQTTARAKDPKTQGQLVVSEKSGTGALPSDWYRWIEHADTQAEYFADGPPGRTALGLRTLSGTPGLLLTSPQFDTLSGNCRIRLVYRTGAEPSNFVLRVRPPRESKGLAIWDAATLPGTGGSWKLAVLALDLKGQKAAAFELSNRAAGPDGAVRVRELIATELPAVSKD